MTGINKKRFGIWLAIFVVFLLIGAGGVALNMMGYGSIGKMRTEVNEYITKFNGLSQVDTINRQENKNIKATLSDKGILVTYKNDKITSKLDFTLKNEDGIKYLETVYNKSETSPETSVKLMIDAVGLKNGISEGQIFNTYQLSDFYSTTLLQGVKLTSSGNNVKVQINLKANILSGAPSNNGNVNNDDSTGYIIILDDTKNFSDYFNYTIPNGFVQGTSGYEMSTGNNTCTIELGVVSKSTEKDAISVANMIAKAENVSVENASINSTQWNKVSAPFVLGGKVNTYTTDANGEILEIVVKSYYANDECDEFEESLINSIKAK